MKASRLKKGDLVEPDNVTVFLPPDYKGWGMRLSDSLFMVIHASVKSVEVKDITGAKITKQRLALLSLLDTAASPARTLKFACRPASKFLLVSRNEKEKDQKTWREE